MTDQIKLKAVSTLLDAFHAEEVLYCHWKSNQHIDASMAGLTDLDVLVARGQTDRLQTALAAAGFKRFQAVFGTSYPAVEDYIGFDEESGRIVHLHLHHFLTLGEPHLKGYRLPWETRVLESRIEDQDFGVYVSSPEMEMLLLLVRQVLKRRLRKRLLEIIGIARESKDFKREYLWLAERIDRKAFLLLANELTGETSIEAFEQVLKSDANQSSIHVLSQKIRPMLKPYRSFAAPTAWFARKFREAVWIVGGISKRKMHFGIPLRRVNPRGGLVVAFLGSDGAGKSTLLADTCDWLGQKLDVYPLYMGSGDGSASLLRLPLKLARRVIEGSVDGSAKSKTDDGKKRSQSSFRKLGKLPWALSLAAEKRSKLKRLVRARNRGLVVICDRYPQNQIKGFNDGPLLDAHQDAENIWLKKLSTWEASAYTFAENTPPDVVLKLIPSVEVAMDRRPELPKEEVERRIDAVKSFSFSDNSEVFEIDADQPLEDVVRKVRSIVWARL